MWPLKKIRDGEALEGYISWNKYIFAKRIVGSAFVFINIFGPVVNLKTIGSLFYPEFINYVRIAWLGVWGTVLLAQAARYAFGTKRHKG